MMSLSSPGMGFNGTSRLGITIQICVKASRIQPSGSIKCWHVKPDANGCSNGLIGLVTETARLVLPKTSIAFGCKGHCKLHPSSRLSSYNDCIEVICPSRNGQWILSKTSWCANRLQATRREEKIG